MTRPLTPRQQDVAKFVADGWSDPQIAHRLGVSIRRVTRIVARLGELAAVDKCRDTRVQIARWWLSQAA